MTVSVAVAGATGYAGSEILRLLLSHPQYRAGSMTIGALTGASHAGQSVETLMPHLVELHGRTIEKTEPSRLAEHDIVFLALPHGHSAKIAQSLPSETLIIDCGADFRLTDEEQWDAFYDSPYAGSWPYGIPEMPGHRKHIASARRIAVPGCFPTGATLALLPALTSKLITPKISIVSVTGVSGAGKKPSVDMLGSETMGSARAYKTGGKHRHTPEITQNLQEACDEPVQVSFTPVLAPMQRGILTTASAPASEELVALTGKDPQAARDAIKAAYRSFYSDEKFVVVLSGDQQPATQSVLGSNAVHIQAEYDVAAQRVVVTSAIDNLVKGTAGAAIQCMNIAQGWPEDFALSLDGVTP
ncbi:N-acetyl-gamma-glutamyl-phosphate reductase [uncultured Corynebacterium sp.]|uniref:N-acetyl-gamma-glutamyl-phosphate reductase n=1 Tax=uncultured Corynebacterium sp. TaxID=159447 RepID=UPI0025CE3700|nr:N-acetyl-gamma-glutamyl-phosphate reductase [uncultured Corynebacterium sp.]